MSGSCSERESRTAPIAPSTVAPAPGYGKNVARAGTSGANGARNLSIPITSSAPSERPWYAPWYASTRGLPVASSAVFSANSTASAPDVARYDLRRSPGASFASRASSCVRSSVGCTSPIPCIKRCA